jgi:hypothetical protein
MQGIDFIVGDGWRVVNAARGEACAEQAEKVAIRK